MKHADLKALPSDPIFGVLNLYKKDTARNKVNLVVGAYRDDNEKYLYLSNDNDNDNDNEYEYEYESTNLKAMGFTVR